MSRLIAVALCAFVCLVMVAAAGARAEGRQFLGYGRLVTNDVFGDTHDRWRSGSIASSRVWGPEWAGQAPDRLGQLLEFRVNAEIITPENINGARPGDRPFAGVLSFGLHSHFSAGRTQMALGADLVATGPQTQLDHVQQAIHDLLGGDGPSTRTRAAQIGDDVTPTAVFEAGRPLALGSGGKARLRPFVEGRWGIETLVRAGADLTIGPVGQGGLMARAPVTGHRYRVIERPFAGASFVLGADVAHVAESELLPESRGFALTDTRNRVRAGVHWQGQKGGSLFYGVTWLDKEFRNQRESQVVGSIRLNLEF
jgi:hypothetical protein